MFSILLVDLREVTVAHAVAMLMSGVNMFCVATGNLLSATTCTSAGHTPQRVFGDFLQLTSCKSGYHTLQGSSPRSSA